MIQYLSEPTLSAIRSKGDLAVSHVVGEVLWPSRLYSVASVYLNLLIFSMHSSLMPLFHFHLPWSAQLESTLLYSVSVVFYSD